MYTCSVLDLSLWWKLKDYSTDTYNVKLTIIFVMLRHLSCIALHHSPSFPDRDARMLIMYVGCAGIEIGSIPASHCVSASF